MSKMNDSELGALLNIEISSGDWSISIRELINKFDDDLCMGACTSMPHDRKNLSPVQKALFHASKYTKKPSDSREKTEKLAKLFFERLNEGDAQEGAQEIKNFVEKLNTLRSKIDQLEEEFGKPIPNTQLLDNVMQKLGVDDVIGFTMPEDAPVAKTYKSKNVQKLTPDITKVYAALSLAGVRNVDKVYTALTDQPARRENRIKELLGDDYNNYFKKILKEDSYTDKMFDLALELTRAKPSPSGGGVASVDIVEKNINEIYNSL